MIAVFACRRAVPTHPTKPGSQVDNGALFMRLEGHTGRITAQASSLPTLQADPPYALARPLFGRLLTRDIPSDS